MESKLQVNFLDDNPPRILRTDGRNTGFSELNEVLFIAPSSAGWILEIDDEVLTPEPKTVAHWHWKPGFFAGEVLAKLSREGSSQHVHYRLDVSPDRSKLGRDVFHTMLRELWDNAPELAIGTEPAKGRMGAFGRYESPYVAFCRLRMYGRRFLAAVERVAVSPIRMLHYRRRFVQLQAIRRVDVRTAQCALRDPYLNAVLTGDEPDDLNPKADFHLDIPVVEPHVDNHANHCLLAMLQAVIRKAKYCLHGLEREAERQQDTETRTSVMRRLAVRQKELNLLLRDLERIRRRSPFTLMTSSQVSAAGLNVISAHPLYARAYGLGWRSIRHGVAGEPTDEDVWLSPTWEVYERWAFYKLISALQSELGCNQVELSSSEPRCERSWVGRDGCGNTIHLYYQPEFPNWSRASNQGFRSLSRTRYPDIVITLEGPIGTKFIVLDAKYQQSRISILESMASAHIYHDSLRWNDRKSDKALLLIPAGGGAKWLEEIGFRQEFDVGAVELFSETSELQIRQLIESLFDTD